MSCIRRVDARKLSRELRASNKAAAAGYGSSGIDGHGSSGVDGGNGESATKHDGSANHAAAAAAAERNVQALAHTAEGRAPPGIQPPVSIGGELHRLCGVVLCSAVQ